MTEDSCKVGSKETRPALNDMTNLPNKRGVSSILSDLLLKSGDEYGKTVACEDPRVKFSKRLCLVVEDLVKENSRASDSSAGSTSLNAKNTSGEGIDGKEPMEPKDASNLINLGVLSSKGEDDDVVNGHGNAWKEMCISSTSVQTHLELDEASNMASDANQCNTESFDRVIMESSRSKEGLGSFEMHRFSTVCNMEHANHDMGIDLLKSCSCSFCLTAAYIWSDLHYQDLKGRLSVLKKSQKEASNLLQRNSRVRTMASNGLANSSSSIKLESDLMSQWISLFSNMGDILARESNHLQKSFANMKDLREGCKIDLERSTKPPQHKL